MENWQGAFSLFSREVTRFRKIMVDTIVSPVVSNLLYLIIFNLALTGREVQGIEYIKFLAPGLICMTLITSAFSNPSFAMVIAKFSGTITDLLMVPLTGMQIVTAYVGAAVFRALITAFVTFIVILFFTELHPYNLYLTMLSALLTAFFFGTMGVVFGYFAKQFDRLTMMNTFVITPMTFLGGVFYSVTVLIEPWKTISLLNPMFYFIDFFRYSVIGISHVDPFISLTVSIVSNLILFPFAVYLFSKGDKLINI